jgi:hypothetical protein
MMVWLITAFSTPGANARNYRARREAVLAADIAAAARVTHDRMRHMSGESAMTAFNVVRFRVKPGRDQQFLDAHKNIQSDWAGLKHVNIVKTGERGYCIIGEWTDMDAIAKARPDMIKTLDTFRDTLEDLGGGLGVTDPVSGPVVMALK